MEYLIVKRSFMKVLLIAMGIRAYQSGIYHYGGLRNLL